MTFESTSATVTETLHPRGTFDKQVIFNIVGRITLIVVETFFILKVKIFMENNLNSQVEDLPTRHLQK